jgi:hypothetical protein
MADFLLVSSNVGQVSYLPAQEGILRYSVWLLNGPAAVCLNHRVNFGHKADGVVQGGDDFGIVVKVDVCGNAPLQFLSLLWRLL